MFSQRFRLTIHDIDHHTLYIIVDVAIKLINACLYYDLSTLVSDPYSLYKITLRAATKIGFATDVSEVIAITDEDGKSIEIYIYCFFSLQFFYFYFIIGLRKALWKLQYNMRTLKLYTVMGRLYQINQVFRFNLFSIVN